MYLFSFLSINQTAINLAAQSIGDVALTSMLGSMKTINAEMEIHRFVSDVDALFRPQVSDILNQNIEAFKDKKQKKDQNALYVDKTTRQIENRFTRIFLARLLGPVNEIESNAGQARLMKRGPGQLIAMKMNSDWGRAALRAKNDLQQEEQKHVVRARESEDAKEIIARLEMANANWIRILEGNSDTKQKMDELVSGSYPGEKLDDYVFRQPHPEWDKDFMLLVIRQRLANDEAWIQYEEAILGHPKTKAYSTAVRAFQMIIGNYKMMPRHFNSMRLEHLITHSLEKNPSFQGGDEYYKPEPFVYESDFQHLFDSEDGYKPSMDYTIMEPAALQDYFGMILSVLEKDLGLLSRRKMKMDVFHSILKYLETNFPSNKELNELTERYHMRQSIEVGVWEKILADNIRFFMDLKIAIDIQAFKLQSKAMEREIAQARPKQRTLLRKKLNEFISDTPQEIPKNALKKFQEILMMIWEVPGAASWAPRAAVLLKREMMSNGAISDRVKTELFLRVLVPAVEAIKTEAFSVITSLLN